MTPSILAVVVLYKTSPQESETVLTLRNAARSVAPQDLRLRTILVDNTPGEQRASEKSNTETYLSFPHNPGLAHAYNLALEIARREGFDWLLTLDQDTTLPEDYLLRIKDVLIEVAPDPMIGTVVPQLWDRGKTISPYRYRWGMLPQWLPAGLRGVPDEAVFALNSGAILRVSALLQAGGYDPAFWLDGSDHSMFAALAALGKRTFVMGDLPIHHNLSVLDSIASFPLQRAGNMLDAESAFHDLWLNRAASFLRNVVLVRRAVRSLLCGRPDLAWLTSSHVLWRITHSRTKRLREWHTRTAARMSHPNPVEKRLLLKISVCMASYNAARYIEEQIRSVLPQLSARDELVIVDDASRDGTPERIEAIGDTRIRLIRQAENRGVVRTFEHALRAATGDILFLCDGDDIWAADKLEKVLQSFCNNPAAQVVATGLALIDEEGRPISKSGYMYKRSFTDSIRANFVRNRFQGSAMAVRSSLLQQALPFPKDKAFLHDAWIGLVNRATGGAAAYVPEPLLLYRRHSSNVSKPMSSSRRALARLQLAAALIRHVVIRVVFGPPDQRTRVSLRQTGL